MGPKKGHTAELSKRMLLRSSHCPNRRQMAESNSEATIMLTLPWRPIATISLAGWQAGTRVLKINRGWQ